MSESQNPLLDWSKVTTNVATTLIVALIFSLLGTAALMGGLLWERWSKSWVPYHTVFLTANKGSCPSQWVDVGNAFLLLEGEYTSIAEDAFTEGEKVDDKESVLVRICRRIGGD